jgi:hypothetical protein
MNQVRLQDSCFTHMTIAGAYSAFAAALKRLLNP